MSDQNEAKAPEKQADNTKVDDELSALLDSALEDFKRESAKNDDDGKKEADSESKTSEEKEKDDTVGGDPEEATVEEWNDEFITQTAAQFESQLAALLGEGGPEQIQQKLQQLAEAAQTVIDHPNITADSTDFAATISQTIQGLNSGTENLIQQQQNAPFTDQDFANLFANNQDTNSFMPFMQGMMQSLLSKEVLYPSLKDILDRFPTWLDGKRGDLAQEEVQRYENQMKLMGEVCGELEGEQESDTVEVKRERFDKVLGLMQKLQDYGQPPADLVGDVGPPLPVNDIDPNQCNLM